MRRMFITAALAAATLAIGAEMLQAQVFIGRGRGAVSINTPYYSSYYGPGWYGGPYYSSGFSTYSYPMYGYSGYNRVYYGSGYPSYSYPYYMSSRYGPVYNYAPATTGATYYSGPVYQESRVPLTSTSSGGYRSFYPSADPQTATVRVLVPTDTARVWIDDQPTQQSGTDRLYVTPPLETGKNYSYTVRASWMQGGQEVNREKKVPIEPGKNALVNFME